MGMEIAEADGEVGGAAAGGHQHVDHQREDGRTVHGKRTRAPPENGATLPLPPCFNFGARGVQDDLLAYEVGPLS